MECLRAPCHVACFSTNEINHVPLPLGVHAPFCVDANHPCCAPSSSIEEGRSYPPVREISTVGGWRHKLAWKGTGRNISPPAAADGCEVTNGRVLQHLFSPPVR